MPNRPGLLDLRSDSHGSNASSSSRPLRSPRMHIAGEAPPELSPLDAFAMQSRLLAKQLQESEKEGHRMSRLPPLTVESPLIVQGRSDYFRSMSCEDDDADDLGGDQPSGLGLRTAYEEPFGTPEERPRSMHPRMSRIPPTPEQMTAPSHPMPDMSRGRELNQIEEDATYFGARRERSPSPLQSDTQSQFDKPAERAFSRRENSLSRPSPLQIASLPGSPGQEKQRSLDDLGLAPPPRSLFPKRSSSIMSSPLIPPDEDSLSSVGASFHSLPARKLSSGSAALPQVAPSPVVGRHSHRSSSVGSDSSALPRPSFNFSRPLSRAGTPSFDPPSRLETPSRQASSDSQPSFVLADESAHTPVSMHSDAFAEMTAEDKPGAPSYIYSKFSLPRGKTIQRSEPSETQPQASFTYDLPMVPPSNVHRIPAGAPPSPPSRPSTASARPTFDDGMSAKGSPTRPSLDASKLSMDSTRLPPGRPSVSSGRHVPIESSPFAEESSRGRTLTSMAHDGPRGRTPASTNTSDSASTIRPPPTSHSSAPTASEMSAEEHLAKGIDCHENGSLKESTYHLRYAARQNNPTAMLLYALACRHGWGMRANQKEGVEWLRKAAEYASIEIADDEDQVKEGKHVDYVERRTRKAQFALSIYELGVSHMNGWGIDQDKSLAVRCFEIAGSKRPPLIKCHEASVWTMLTASRLGRCRCSC